MRIGFAGQEGSRMKRLSDMMPEKKGPNMTRGKALLPDLPTAILADLKGYRLGFYPTPLEGVAEKLGYYPIQSATPEELTKIKRKMEEIEATWNRF